MSTQAKIAKELPLGRPYYWRTGLTRRIQAGLRIEAIEKIDDSIVIRGWAFGINYFRVLSNSGEHNQPKIRVSWNYRMDVAEQHAEYVSHTDLGFEIELSQVSAEDILEVKTSPLDPVPYAAFDISDLYEAVDPLASRDIEHMGFSISRIQHGNLYLVSTSNFPHRRDDLSFDCEIKSGDESLFHLGQTYGICNNNSEGVEISIPIGPVILFSAFLAADKPQVCITCNQNGQTWIVDFGKIEDSIGTSFLEWMPKSNTLEPGFDFRIENVICSDGIFISTKCRDNLLSTEIHHDVVQFDRASQRCVITRSHPINAIADREVQGLVDQFSPVLVVFRGTNGEVLSTDLVTFPWLYKAEFRRLLIQNFPQYWRSFRQLEYLIMQRQLRRIADPNDGTDKAQQLEFRHYYLNNLSRSDSVAQIPLGLVEGQPYVSIRPVQSLQDLNQLLLETDSNSSDVCIVLHDSGIVSPDLEIYLNEVLYRREIRSVVWSGIASDSRGFLFHLPPQTDTSAGGELECRSIAISLHSLRIKFQQALQQQSSDRAPFDRILEKILDEFRNDAYCARVIGTLLNFRVAGNPGMNVFEPVFRVTSRSNPPWTVVVSYRDEIERTINAILSLVNKHRATEFEFLLIDNQSKNGATDSLREQLVHQVGELRVITMQYPYGFNHSAQTNMGVRYASNDHILVMSNDAIFLTENGLCKAAESLSSTNVMTVGFASIQDFPTKSTIRRFIGAGQQLMREGMFAGLTLANTDDALLTQVIRTPALRRFVDFPDFAIPSTMLVGGNSFECVAFMKNRFELEGGLDENRTPTDLNDVEFSLRTIGRDYRHILLTGVQISHKPRGSRRSELVRSSEISLISYPGALESLLWKTVYRI